MRITERRLRSIIRNVIREAAEEDIYARFPSDHEDLGYEDSNVVDFTGEENFPDGEIDYADDHDIESPGPFGLTPEEREELYASRDYPENFQPKMGTQGREPMRVAHEKSIPHKDDPSWLGGKSKKVKPKRPSGPMHSSQIDMLDDMGEIGHYDEDDYDY